MLQLERFRRWAMVTLAIFVVVSAEKCSLGQNGSGLGLVVTVMTSIAGAAIASAATNYFFRMEWFRSLVLGSKFIEGHWLLITRPLSSEDKTSPLLHVGVAHMHYDLQSQEFCVVTTRLDSNGIPFETSSEVAHLRTTGPTIRYLNFFRLGNSTDNSKDSTKPGLLSQSGFSAGHFPRVHAFGRAPTRLVSEISLDSESIKREQIGFRILDQVAQSYYLEHKEKWVTEFLRIVNKQITDVSDDCSRYDTYQNLTNKLAANRLGY